MLKSGFTLTTDDHLEAAMFNKSEVTVWQEGELIDFDGGSVESFTEISVTINNADYLRETCEFRVR